MIPDFQSLMRPVLAFLSDGADRPVSDVTEHVSDEYGLTPQERAELIPSGGQRLINNKTHWAISHMFQARLVTRPSRGHVQITEAGLAVLAAYPDRVDMKVLRTFPSYVAFRAKSKEKAASSQTSTVVDVEEQVSPLELLGIAVAENEAAVESELLTRALALDPAGFERLVLSVLGAMGYGRAGAIEHSGKPGDGGIDGIISQDPLGLDRIYLQAKRYSPGNGVQRPDVQQFVGALMSAQGDRGVFLTTSSFSSGAILEAEKVNARIELIDGPRLARLMLKHGVGVQARTTVVLHEIDEDFFDSV